MARRKKLTIFLEEAKSRFEEWRRNRRGKAAIPDEPWVAAAEVARHEGVSRTSTELRVEWNELKCRMAVPEPLPKPTPPPAFVEMVAQRTQSHPECTIEPGAICAHRFARFPPGTRINSIIRDNAAASVPTGTPRRKKEQGTE